MLRKEHREVYMSGKTKFIVAGVLVFVLLAAGIGGTIALAQGPTPTPPSGGKTWVDLYWQALAQKLGTTVEKLQQAMTDARKESADQAVKQGLLTQAQADRMLQRQVPGMPFGRGAAGDAYTSIANAGLDAAAKTLGMSSADLTTALKSKTLLTLAQEKNVDVTKLRTAIADAEKAAIDQAVKDGKLTQAQADSLKANLKPENIDLNRRSFGLGGRGGFDGFGGFGGRVGRGGMGAPFGGRFGRR
jgi:ABC-type Na+ efflux pump permease subunit